MLVRLTALDLRLPITNEPLMPHPHTVEYMRNRFREFTFVAKI